MSFARGKKPYSRPASRPKGSEGEWLHDRAPGAPVVAASRVQTVNSAAPGSTTKLMVSNLHYEVTAKDLTQIFGVVGTLVREPLIRYDRSGRSSGVAIVTYETPEEAVRAKQQFDEKTAKGQPMSITLYAAPAPRPRPGRSTSAPSLLNRIQKPPLLDRLSGKDKDVKTKAQEAPAKSSAGPIRTKARGGKREPKKPKTAEELDLEIDAFMHDDLPARVAPPPAATVAATASTEGDVEMT